MEIRCIAEYLGMDVITNGSNPHQDFVYFNIHNSLLDSSMGTPITAVKEMVERAKNTGAVVHYARNNVGRTIFAVPAVNINAVIFQEILALAKGLKTMAISQGKTLEDIFEVRGLELHRVHYECSIDTIINGDVVSENETTKIVDVNDHSMSDLLELESEKLSFGLFAKVDI